MFEVLQQAFPAHSPRGVWRMSVLIGAFVALFLLFFQPFGLKQVPDGGVKTMILAGYGLVSFSVINLLALIFPALFPNWFKPESWTVGKEIGFMLFNFMVVGLFNFLYTAVAFNYPFNWATALYFQLITLSVGLFPVTVIVLWRHSRLLSRNLKLARELNASVSQTQPPAPVPFCLNPQPAQSNAKEHTFTFTSDSGTEQICLTADNFLFAAAADNYVELHYLENDEYKKSLIRSSLSRLEETVQHLPFIVRCHRTYVVNLHQVQSASGNAQGLKLQLRHSSFPVPVSRKMVTPIKALL